VPLHVDAHSDVTVGDTRAGEAIANSVAMGTAIPPLVGGDGRVVHGAPLELP
jgi:hypothetical protein